MFESILPGPPDVMYDLKMRADNDKSSAKVDLGVGIYRNNVGQYQELQVVKKAKKILAQNDPGHDYEVTTGNELFLRNAAELMFGQDCPRLPTTRPPTVYVGIPAWGNYKPLMKLVGLDVVEYTYYDSIKRSIDFPAILRAARDAPSGSVFILQGCCHNPTGADPSPAQWDELALCLKQGGHLPLLDVAYQGLGDGLEEDVYSVRAFARRGFDMLVCQSFSKNFALYGERCGALHAVCGDARQAANVRDRLRCLIRWEFSSAPAFGSRLVNITLGSDALRTQWQEELGAMQQRIKTLRQELRPETGVTLRGKQDSFRAYLTLTPAQCKKLIDKYHIYLPPNGRINVSGLNESNLGKVATAIDQVVRESLGLVRANLA
uniref:Aminotransferase class I/classII large domain-containing protein n=1 Tax=Bionectria ochroleuca TaxID=29856 RepID=A0A8H7KFP4_BIOOC